MCSGGGSSQPTTTTVQNTNIPSYLQPQAEQLAGQAQALTNTSKNPFNSYIGNASAGGQGIQGTTVAGQTGLQQQAANSAGNMSVAPQIGQGSNLAAQAGYNASGPQAFAQNVQGYMSPYTQTLQNQAISNYASSLPQLGSAASKAGGLGGSREALMQSQAQQGLQGQLAGIQANAFTNAQSEFNTQNQNALYAANTLGNLGQNQYAQQSGIANLQNALGTQQQQTSQNVNNALNQNFQNKQNYPYAQMAFLSGILHGTSPGALGAQSTTSQYQAPANATAMLGSAAGLYAATQGAKKGGKVTTKKSGLAHLFATME